MWWGVDLSALYPHPYYINVGVLESGKKWFIMSNEVTTATMMMTRKVNASPGLTLDLGQRPLG
jgi:hypothetical protein